MSWIKKVGKFIDDAKERAERQEEESIKRLDRKADLETRRAKAEAKLAAARRKREKARPKRRDDDSLFGRL